MRDSAHSTIVHGAGRLAAVTVDAYNAELRAGKGFIGDRASNRAFRELLEKGRERMREVGDDPLGAKPTEDLSKKKLDKTLITASISRRRFASSCRASVTMRPPW